MERDTKINAKLSGDSKVSSPGFYCKSRMMVAEAGFVSGTIHPDAPFHKTTSLQHPDSFSGVFGERFQPQAWPLTIWEGLANGWRKVALFTA